MMSSIGLSRILLASAALAIGIAAFAQAGQKPTPTPTAAATVPSKLLPPERPGDTVFMETKVGSFKLLPKGNELPSGKMDITFTGTFLISDLAPGSSIVTQGTVHKEYDERGKQVYFGKGRIVLSGKFSNCQWFGRDMHLTFKGSGFFRVVGEYDQNLNTGFFWFRPNEKREWSAYLTPVIVPEEGAASNKAVTREQFEKDKKKKAGGG